MNPKSLTSKMLIVGVLFVFMAAVSVPEALAENALNSPRSHTVYDDYYHDHTEEDDFFAAAVAVSVLVGLLTFVSIYGKHGARGHRWADNNVVTDELPENALYAKSDPIKSLTLSSRRYESTGLLQARLDAPKPIASNRGNVVLLQW